jgi:hypothetical protein
MTTKKKTSEIKFKAPPPSEKVAYFDEPHYKKQIRLKLRKPTQVESNAWCCPWSILFQDTSIASGRAFGSTDGKAVKEATDAVTFPMSLIRGPLSP